MYKNPNNSLIFGPKIQIHNLVILLKIEFLRLFDSVPIQAVQKH